MIFFSWLRIQTIPPSEAFGREATAPLKTQGCLFKKDFSLPFFKIKLGKVKKCFIF
jgi:hypothetical protein